MFLMKVKIFKMILSLKLNLLIVEDENKR